MCEYRKCALNNEGSCQMVREGGFPARQAYEDGLTDGKAELRKFAKWDYRRGRVGTLKIW